jgi:hypothetical protein
LIPAIGGGSIDGLVGGGWFDSGGAALEAVGGRVGGGAENVDATGTGGTAVRVGGDKDIPTAPKTGVATGGAPDIGKEATGVGRTPVTEDIMLSTEGRGALTTEGGMSSFFAGWRKDSEEAFKSVGLNRSDSIEKLVPGEKAEGASGFVAAGMGAVSNAGDEKREAGACEMAGTDATVEDDCVNDMEEDGTERGLAEGGSSTGSDLGLLDFNSSISELRSAIVFNKRFLSLWSCSITETSLLSLETCL